MLVCTQLFNVGLYATFYVGIVLQKITRKKIELNIQTLAQAVA
jgi:hypothetical protein